MVIYMKVNYHVSNHLTDDEINSIKELEKKLNNKVILIAYEKEGND